MAEIRTGRDTNLSPAHDVTILGHSQGSAEAHLSSITRDRTAMVALLERAEH
jgi:hypothetical protein